MIVRRRKRKISKKNLPQCHFVHHKFHMDCLGIETGSHLRRRLPES
jgi:hypothetical protein